MFYLKFIDGKSNEVNVSGFCYKVSTRQLNTLITVKTRDVKGVFEESFLISKEEDLLPEGKNCNFVSAFIMNINGQTLDKIIY